MPKGPHDWEPGYRKNAGHTIIHTWTVWLSIADEDEDAGYYLDLLEIEAPATTRLDTVVIKALKLAEMRGWEFTHQEIQVTKGEALPSGYTKRSGKS